MPGLIRAFRDLFTRLLSRRRGSGREKDAGGAMAGSPAASPAERAAGGEQPDHAKDPRPVIPAGTPVRSPGDRPGPSRWRIRESPGSAFEKAGRIIIEGENLVIHIDREPRWFCIPLGDIAAVLADDSRAILLSTGDMVGTARLSASGRAVNFLIGPVLYTTPLARVIDVLEGRARKAAVFAGEARPRDHA